MPVVTSRKGLSSFLFVPSHKLLLSYRFSWCRTCKVVGLWHLRAIWWCIWNRPEASSPRCGRRSQFISTRSIDKLWAFLFRRRKQTRSTIDNPVHGRTPARGVCSNRPVTLSTSADSKSRREMYIIYRLYGSCNTLLISLYYRSLDNVTLENSAILRPCADMLPSERACRVTVSSHLLGELS